MSQLVDVLYPVPDLRRTGLSTVRWWESRRLQYNKIVGATGLGTIGAVALFAALPPSIWGGELSLAPLFVGSMVYGVLANVCYTFGWMIELVARAVWGRQAPDLGPLLFRHGLIFSVGLTLLPVLLSAMLWVMRIIIAVLG